MFLVCGTLRPPLWRRIGILRVRRHVWKDLCGGSEVCDQFVEMAGRPRVVGEHEDDVGALGLGDPRHHRRAKKNHGTCECAHESSTARLQENPGNTSSPSRLSDSLMIETVPFARWTRVSRRSGSMIQTKTRRPTDYHPAANELGALVRRLEPHQIVRGEQCRGHHAPSRTPS